MSYPQTQSVTLTSNPIALFASTGSPTPAGIYQFGITTDGTNFIFMGNLLVLSILDQLVFQFVDTMVNQPILLQSSPYEFVGYDQYTVFQFAVSSDNNNFLIYISQPSEVPCTIITYNFNNAIV